MKTQKGPSVKMMNFIYFAALIPIRRTDHATHLYPQKLALAWLTSGGRSVGTVCSRTKATELLLLLLSRFVIPHYTHYYPQAFVICT
jgi:hypothetical protein